MPSHTRSASAVEPPSRPPLSAARTIRPSHSNGQLAKDFQDRHATTYAHLYGGPDMDLVADEKAKRDRLREEQSAIEAERAAARERREAYLKTIGAGGEDKENSRNDGGHAGASGSGRARVGAWRPLSLVAKRQAALGHARSASASIPERLLQGIAPTPRSASHTPSTSLALQHPIASESVVTRRPLSFTPPQLEVVVESDTYGDEFIEEIKDESVRSSSDMGHPTRTRRGGSSTYSWATSFSGETSELRAAAHYAPSSDGHGRGSLEGTPSREGVCGQDDTPTRTERRRKRIVTLAHTVRQLEGVGSREPEDPNFYLTLVKAWNERPGVVPVPVPEGPRPILNTTTQQRRMTALNDAPPALGANAFAGQGYQDWNAALRAAGVEATPAMTEPSPALGVQSPEDLYTPAVPQDEMHPTDPRISRVTRSTRYSYASTLHDLALEGGYTRGNQLMADKPWLREKEVTGPISGASSRFGGNDAFAFDMPPPLRMTLTPKRVAMPRDDTPGSGTTRNSFDKLHASIATSDWLKPTSSTSTRARPLRRVEGQVLRYGQPNSVPGSPSRAIDFSIPPPLPPRPTTDEASASVSLSGPSWGLGFMSSWWNDRPSVGTAPASHGRAKEQDFHLGEDDRSGPSFQSQTIPNWRHQMYMQTQMETMTGPGTEMGTETETHWKNWTKETSVYGGIDLDSETGNAYDEAKDSGSGTAPGLRVLVQGRKRSRASSWSSGQRTRPMSSLLPRAEVDAQEEVSSAIAPHLSPLNTTTPTHSESRAQTPYSYTEAETYSFHTRTSRNSISGNANASPYDYTKSSDSSFSATYPHVLGQGVRVGAHAHARSMSIGSINASSLVFRPHNGQYQPRQSQSILPQQVKSINQQGPLAMDMLQETERMMESAAQTPMETPTHGGIAERSGTGIGIETGTGTGSGETSTEIGAGEREFPFSSLCRRPSSSTPSRTSLQLPRQPMPAPQSRDQPDQRSHLYTNTSHSHSGPEQLQVRRAADLGLGPPPLQSSMIRWTPDMEREMEMTTGSTAVAIPLDGSEGREQRAKEVEEPSMQEQGKGGWHGWENSSSRLDPAVIEAASSGPIQMETIANTSDRPAFRPKLSSRPQLNVLRQKPSLTIKLPSQDMDMHRRTQTNFVRRKSVSPLRCVPVENGIRTDAETGMDHLAPPMLTPSGSNSQPSTSTTSGFSHDELFLPPPTTPIAGVSIGIDAKMNTGMPMTPVSPAFTEGNLYLGVPLDSLPTPPLGVFRQQQQDPRQLQMAQEDRPLEWTRNNTVLPLPSSIPSEPKVYMANQQVESRDGPAEASNVGLNQSRIPYHPVSARLPVRLPLPGPSSPSPRRDHERVSGSDPLSCLTGSINDYPSSRPRAEEGTVDVQMRAMRRDGVCRPGMGYEDDHLSPVRHLTGDVAVQAATQPVLVAPKHAVTIQKKRAWLPATFFWLGWIMPWCWLIAGWGLPGMDGETVGDVEKGNGSATGPGVASTLPMPVEMKPEARARHWLYHSDPWCRRSRVAAATVLPAVAVGAVIGVVVLAVLR